MTSTLLQKKKKKKELLGCSVVLRHYSRERAAKLELSGHGLIALDLFRQEPNSVEAGLVDVWGKRAAGQVGQGESAGEGNQAGRHLQDGQQPLAGISDALWCLQAKNTTQDQCKNKMRERDIHPSIH